MGGVKEIKIDSTLWTTPARLVNLIDFKPEKICIETKTNAINNMKVQNIKNDQYQYLQKYQLTMLFDDINKQNKYYQVWKDIFGVINRGRGELKLHEKVVLHDGDFPIKRVFKIHSITIVIKSLIEKNIKCYLELSLNYCLYKV